MRHHDQVSSADESFQQFASRLDYPMFVVTTAVADERAGCLVGFSTQASIDPVRYLVALSNKNRTYRLALRADHLAVHAFAREHADRARFFGGRTGDDIDKFSESPWRPGPAGMPILDDAAGWFVGRILKRIPFGDHDGFLLAPMAAEVAEAAGGLVSFSDVRTISPGHEA